MSVLIHRPTPKIFIFLLIATLTLGACAQAQAPSQRDEAYNSAKQSGGAPAQPPALAVQAPAPVAPGSGGSGATDSSAVQNQDADKRLVIKNANLTLVVTDPGKSMSTISAMAAEMGGFVVTANVYKETTSSGAEAPRASVTIRVPAERLDEALSRIKGESKEDPLNENIGSQDVTSEYTDLQSRLRNLEAAEADLTKIMDQATKTEDVLAVYQQLVSIREQIEVIKGQIQYFEKSAALSAISVDLIADIAVQPLEIAGWQPQGVAKNAVEALVSTMQGIANAAIWIVIYLLPVVAVLFVIFVLPFILLFRYLRKRSKQRKAAVVVAPPAE